MLHNGKFWLVVILILLVLVSGWWAAFFYRQQVYKPFNPSASSSTAFVIQSGESGSEIGNRLEAEGLIKSTLFFRIYLRLLKIKGESIQAGEYELSPALSLAQIVDKFSHGTFDLKLTFIEGWRKEQYASYLNNKLGEGFALAFLNDPQAKEGFLFPDTYLISRQTEPATLVSLLRSNFDKKLTADLIAGLTAQGLNLDQGVILASIVEREAKEEKDRPRVAGILIKRLKNNWPLEADATTQYAKANQVCCEWWNKNLSAEDLNLDSPFNTRKVLGLPPAAIANPSLSALRAVANPTLSEDWYYLSDEKGQIHYSQTLEEHQQKIATYLSP